jgi:hypothetical protein
VNVSVVHTPEHNTGSGTGTFVKDVQIQQHALGYWVLEEINVTVS